MSSQPKDTRNVSATQCYIGTPADANAQDHYYADADDDVDVGLAKHSLLACGPRSAVRTDVGNTVFASEKQ